MREKRCRFCPASMFKAACCGLAVAENDITRLLVKFVENQGDADDRILRALESGDKKDAILLAHTLKGVSGNIGAMKLHEQARVVEALLRADDDDGLPAELVKMTGTLRRTCQTLQSVLVEQRDESRLSNAEPDRAAILPHLKKLSLCLLGSETKALSILEEILPMVGGTTMETAFTRIARHVAAYAFEEALDELENISRKFDLRLSLPKGGFE